MDDEVHSPPTMELFQQVYEIARKTIQNVADEKQHQKEDEVVQEENVQDEATMATLVTEYNAHKVGDASLQEKDKNVAETTEYQKVDEVIPQHVEENSSNQDHRVEENTEQVA